MKKLLLTILILMLLPMSVDADNSQNIVFTGTYSFNNEGTDADSAWLFIRYDGTLVDSTKITPEDLQWDGYYQYIHACTNDSVWGWSGWWIYFDGLVVSLPELAIVATARDSSYALEASVTALRDTAQYLITADTTGIAQDVYAEFTDGNNEDVFKATGFSTFDPATDSVLVTMAVLFARLAADSVAMNLLPGVIDSTVYDTASMRFFFELFFASVSNLGLYDSTAAVIGDSLAGLMDSLLLKARHAQVDSLKDTVEALSLNVSSQAQVDSLKDTVEDMSTRLLATGFSTHSQVDSLKDTVEDMSTRLLATGFSTFDPASDPVMVDEIKADVLGDTTLQDNATEYKADTAGLAISTYAEFIDGSNENEFKSSGDTNTNPFDNANDKVTLVDTSADGIHDAEMAALDGLDSANVIHQKLFFQGLSDSSGSLTDTELRAAIGDSLYNERMDSLLTVLVEVKGYSLDLAYYWGACDGCYYRLFPEGGLADKDSAIIIDPSQGADSLVGKVVYLHGTDVQIVDTVYFYRNEPW